MTKPTTFRIAYNTFDKCAVLTAMWAPCIESMRYPEYETFVWSYDKAEGRRGLLLKKYKHENRGRALDFHFRFCKSLAHRQLKQVLPDDSPFEDNPF